ncbi:hypothetical protein Tco_1346329 [Tanacetum coccineum]
MLKGRKETEDKIKEGTLKVDHGTDAMTVVLGKENGGYARGVSPVDINPINSSAYEEGGTTVVGCENDASIQKSNGLATLEKEMETRTDGKKMLHNKELPKDCYKVSIDISLVDAACILDVGNNNFKTVKDAATPPSTIQMNVENKTAPKLQTKRKNVYVSSDAMQRQAKKKSLQKSWQSYVQLWYQILTKLMEVFIGGLPQSIEGNVTASKPQTLEEAITITQKLMDQVTKHNSVQGINDHKRKFDDRRTFNNNNY